MTIVLQYIFICVAVFVAGAVDAIAGGGGLISLPCYLIAGIPVHNAIATNKCSACMGTTLATFRYWRMGFIKLKLSALAIVCALMGSTIGARLALAVEDRIFKILMLFIIPVVAFYAFKNKDFGAGKKREPFPERTVCLIAAGIALVIGVYDGFYGPGTGTFLLLLLTGLGRMDLNTAAGTTKAINLATNVAALAVFVLNGKVLMPLGVIAGAASIAGNYVGTSLFKSKGAGTTRPVILIVLVIFFVKIISELI